MKNTKKNSKPIFYLCCEEIVFRYLWQMQRLNVFVYLRCSGYHNWEDPPETNILYYEEYINKRSVNIESEYVLKYVDCTNGNNNVKADVIMYGNCTDDER